jgi:hypothetical protein
VRRISTFFFSILLGSAWLASASAQLPLLPDDAKAIGPLFDAPDRNTLKCALDRWNPALDFAFRFATGYVTYCRLSQFEGKKVTLVTYIRITPEGKPPQLFGSVHRVPEISAEMKQSLGGDLRKMKTDIGLSGAFALGEGRYVVELLLQDDRNRVYRKHWRLRVKTSRSERGVALAIQPLTVQSVDQRSWQTVSPQRGGNLRLTILLDAAPINPYQTRLRAWDRAFLLECVYSLLRQTPHQSVHVVAFNLDQQRELFRSDQFDSSAFQDLSRALKETELSSVSVQALKKRNSPEFLVALANQELAAGRSDAIIFVGPNVHMELKTTAGVLTGKNTKSPPFFYFEYFPWVGAEFPDTIHWLVKAADGTVFIIHGPAQFDESIDKMLKRLKQQ